MVVSRAARQICGRVGPRGVEVVQPAAVSDENVSVFLQQNKVWVLAQLDRVSRLRSLRLPEQRQLGEILFRGEPTPVRNRDR